MVKYKCQICEKKFKNRTDYQRHIKRKKPCKPKTKEEEEEQRKIEEAKIKTDDKIEAKNQEEQLEAENQEEQLEAENQEEQLEAENQEEQLEGNTQEII